MNTKDIIIAGLITLLITKDCKIKTKEKQLNGCRQKLRDCCCVYRRYKDCAKNK